MVIPAGTAKMGNYEYNVDLNMSVPRVRDFNRLPVKYADGTPVFLGDVATVTDTHQPQTNVVRVDGKPATYLMVIKHADASTLAVVDAVKARMPDIRATAPKGLDISLTFDQSTFVRAALWDVVQEAVTAAALVALMVLLFLGSPRSMLIVITSIPLSILTAIIGLKLAGQTINTMTLGGIALAVGMLVDDATVEIENIHRNHAMRKPLLVAILDGAPSDRDADRWSAPWRSASSSSRSCCSPASPGFCSRRWRWRWCSRCSPRTCCRARLVPTMARYLLPENARGQCRTRVVGPVRSGLRGALRAVPRRSIARRWPGSSRGAALSLACVALVVVQLDGADADCRRGFLSGD